MSCAQQILDALAVHADGLTSDELTEHCPDAEGDALLVGRAISQLRTEGKVFGNGTRNNRIIYSLRHALPEEAPEPTTIAPARTPEEPMAAPLAPRILAYLKKSGPAAPAAIAAALKDKRAKDEAKRLVQAGELASSGAGRGTRYGLPGQVLTPARAAAKPRKAAPTRAARKPTKPADRAATPTIDAGFAINAHGCLGLQKAEQRIDLNPAEFSELRQFIERTQPVWNA